MTTIAIGSGKGGVGKTTITANLAICLAQQGKKTIAMDADFGLANLDVVLGMPSGPTLLDLIHGHCDLKGVLRAPPSGFRLLAGSSGVTELANIPTATLQQLLNQLRAIETQAEYLLVDVAAGVQDSALACLSAADEILLVLCQDPSSFMDAYATVKCTINRCPSARFSVVVNRASNPSDAKLFFAKFQAITKERLSVDVQYAGSVPMDAAMLKCSLQRKPVLMANPKADSAQAIYQLGLFLTKEQDHRIDTVKTGQVVGFFQRLLAKTGQLKAA